MESPFKEFPKIDILFRKLTHDRDGDRDANRDSDRDANRDSDCDANRDGDRDANRDDNTTRRDGHCFSLKVDLNPFFVIQNNCRKTIYID